VVPVALGSASAAGEPGAAWWTVALAMVVSLALQVGVNYANDYSDGIRGTDDQRVGPVRLVASGLASPKSVKAAALLAFAVAAACGLVLALATSWWLLVVGLVSIAAAWGYTGGPKPYGYLGLGEVFVFVFFGLVATVGTAFVVLERIPSRAWWAGVLAGSLACALLVVNNLRDLPTDAMVGKRTLAVRIGDPWTRRVYVGLLLLGLVMVLVMGVERTWATVGVAGFLLASKPVAQVMKGAMGRTLIEVLGATGRVQLAVGVLTAAGLVASR
jgi:1,4-dihydroxy-2-naphthoate octaprenyltransferase